MPRIALLLATLCVASPARAGDWYIDGSAVPEHCGRFTIAPGGGENLDDPAAGNAYRLHVTIWDQNQDPVVTLLATDIWLDRGYGQTELATCPVVFSQADSGTDATGSTTISGTILGGLAGDASDGIDCDALGLYVFAIGFVLNGGEPTCVRFDSPDLNGDLAVTVADFGKFSADFNCGAGCDPCHDYNEDGVNSVADFGIFAGYFNQSPCP